MSKGNGALTCQTSLMPCHVKREWCIVMLNIPNTLSCQKELIPCHAKHNWYLIMPQGTHTLSCQRNQYSLSCQRNQYTLSCQRNQYSLSCQRNQYSLSCQKGVQTFTWVWYPPASHEHLMSHHLCSLYYTIIILYWPDNFVELCWQTGACHS